MVPNGGRFDDFVHAQLGRVMQDDYSTRHDEVTRQNAEHEEIMAQDVGTKDM